MLGSISIMSSKRRISDSDADTASLMTTDDSYRSNNVHEQQPIPIESSYKFQELGLGKSMIITPYVFRDDRGEFIETYNKHQFDEKLGLDFAQDCVSVNKIHTLRGLHGDYRTWKLIHCPYGSVLACIIDLNPDSVTYFQSKMVHINDKNRHMLLVPPGFGNSFLVLEDHTVYSYKKTTYFRPGGEFTLHPNYVWPKDEQHILSQRDRDASKGREEFEKAMKLRSDLENNPFLMPLDIK